MDLMEAGIAALSKHQIAQFFHRNAPATQEKCHQEAEIIVGGHVHPAPVQGATSYTVVADNNCGIVQFRAGSNVLDLDLLAYVEQAYRPFTPHHRYIGILSTLHVYTMDDVGGVSIYLALGQLHRNDCVLLRQTVQDFAWFFVSAWKNTPVSMPCPSRKVLHDGYLTQLLQLSQSLPVSFRPTLSGLISRLPELFADEWPLVPHHTDLLENNIHVDLETGRICGICDWKDTIVGPFGTSVWSLEIMLGVRTTKDGWRFHHNQQELRDLFWDSFRSAMEPVTEEQMSRIELARLVGLFLENGFIYVDDVTKVPISEGSYEMRHLEAITLRLWAEAGN